MPATGTFNKKQLVRGPMWLYAGVTPPVGSAELTLSAGVPSDGFLMGYTDAGATIVYSVEQTDEVVDESATPIDTVISGEVLDFTVDLLQLANKEVQKRLFPTGTVVAAGLNFGGLARIPDTARDSYLLTWQLQDSAWAHAMLYEAIQTNEVNLKVSRQERMVANARFKGLADASRTPGDYVGRIRIPEVVAAATTRNGEPGPAEGGELPLREPIAA